MDSEAQGRSNTERATRSLKEAAIIIVGVLIALAVNDWWSNHNDRAEEQS